MKYYAYSMKNYLFKFLFKLFNMILHIFEDHKHFFFF